MLAPWPGARRPAGRYDPCMGYHVDGDHALLSDAASDAEMALIEAAFRGVFDAARLTHGWRFEIEVVRRWNVRVAALRPIVMVMLVDEMRPESDAKRRFGVRVSITQVVGGVGELKPVVMEVLRRHLERALPEGLSECRFDGSERVWR